MATKKKSKIPVADRRQETPSTDLGKHEPRNAFERALIQAASRLHDEAGEVEIDCDAKISASSDGGAYVQAWVWVYHTDVEPEDYIIHGAGNVTKDLEEARDYLDGVMRSGSFTASDLQLAAAQVLLLLKVQKRLEDAK